MFCRVASSAIANPLTILAAANGPPPLLDRLGSVPCGLLQQILNPLVGTGHI